QAGYEVQKRRFAAAGGSNDAEKLSGRNLKVDVVEREQALTALGPITQRDIVQTDLGNSGGAGAYWPIESYDVASPAIAVRRYKRVNLNRKRGRDVLSAGAH